MRIEQAVEAFGRGFTFTKSFTHPFLLERIEPLWVMRDAPRRNSEYRTEQWLVVDVSPADAHAVIVAHRRARYGICAFRSLDVPMEPIKLGFKELGYRFLGAELLFWHDLSTIPPLDPPLPIVRVTTADQAERLKRSAGRTQIRVSDLEETPPRIRQYMAMDGDTPVGWVRSIVAADSGWCSNMYVRPEYRRRGLGRALMSQMLQDDKTAGLASAVLLASHAGALLYPGLGYAAIGQLMSFMPRQSGLEPTKPA